MEDGEKIYVFIQSGEAKAHLSKTFLNRRMVHQNAVKSLTATTAISLLRIQLLPSVLVLLPGFTGGAAISYGAVALPHYMDPDNI